MSKPLKVYGWNESGKWHMIVAATSKTEAARLAGYERPDQMFNLSQTWNEGDIARAIREPGTLFRESYSLHAGWERCINPERKYAPESWEPTNIHE